MLAARGCSAVYAHARSLTDEDENLAAWLHGLAHEVRQAGWTKQETAGTAIPDGLSTSASLPGDGTGASDQHDRGR